MWQHPTWREQIWAQLSQPWDIIVVGGGITGAGILREAARLGLRALLVEQRDFAWGTSSRSSKLVHGGLRYLAQGKLGLIHESVQERQRLLAEGAGLVTAQGFLIAKSSSALTNATYRLGMIFYDLMAGRRAYQEYGRAEFALLAPHISQATGGFRFLDAQTDDARLVLRVISEALDLGAAALSYAAAEQLLLDDRQVVGVRLRDTRTGAVAEARAALVINAAGAWSDQLRRQIGQAPHMRPLRGSHLIFPAWRFPVAQVINVIHPWDKRPVFAVPWEGVTLVGTTDLDHDAALDSEPRISGAEVAYLMAALDHYFPGLGLTLDDVQATYAGVRPVISSGRVAPSQASREHVIWYERGLLTVTGGKLTTFRTVALSALREARRHLPELPAPDRRAPSLTPLRVERPAGTGGLSDPAWARLAGRYGRSAPDLIAAAQPGELECIQGTTTLWAELRWSARHEGVVRLEDLLLRRTRLGLLIAQGGLAQIERIRAICQPELGWDDARWQAEQEAYRELWSASYSLPARAEIPDWRASPAEAPRPGRGGYRAIPLLAAAALLLAWLLGRKKRRPSLPVARAASR
jgi:glycerol-3-phosphate dehydrogenase